MAKGQFDADAFYAALDGQRQSRRITWKKVAEESGVSASTLTRMAQGKRPDVDSLAALTAWSGLKADDFVRAEGVGRVPADTLAQITTYLRADPNLSPEGVEAFEALVKTAYERLRKE
ncbi:helix-turn-helix domain-containing protein [Nitrospirillum sp. BR 11164]|uniref:helix-turn-helix domain-containing protein n=1 Tax=Nitrospirillum sp. BR 11164 TaxID=3104324 RepID=UPI002AFEED50|nr:helix-turn-helix domain-containing protein [Nitrospirillum sp. BR 11164]MEA1653021.1 helix-turn-helix domain-containing protein [Nitrospirillum sp. BR 11164]